MPATPRSISTAVASSGSSTWTNWKRRVSAGSFSKYFLYSSQVVAARVRNSPRARAGEQVGGVAAAFRAAGADQRVRLVDEQDDRLRAVAHGVDHALEALLELALHAGAGLQQAEVEHPQDHLLQRRRHFAGGDAQGQALDHRGLADARRADQDRVVLPPAQENVDALADLPVAPDYGVDAPGAGFGGEVLGVLVEQRVRGAFRLVAACRRAVRRGRLFAGGLDPLQQVGLQGLVGNPQ